MRCRNQEIDNWFAKKALKDHDAGAVRVTCAVEPSAPHRPVGYYAVATVAEEVSNIPGTNYHPFRGGTHFSAMQLVWLATDHAFTRRGIGSIMVGRVIRIFAEIGPTIGLPHLIVTPAVEDYERLVAFYGRLGFLPYKDGESMYLTLALAKDAVSKATP